MENSLAPFISDRALRAEIIQLNYYPASYMDSSWLDSVDYGELIVSLRESGQNNKPLSEYLLSVFAQEQAFDFDFSGKSSSLLLLDRLSLQRLVRMAGIVVNAKRINSIIQGKTIKAIKQALGDDLYSFSHGKARLLLGTPPSYALDKEIVGDCPWEVAAKSSPPVEGAIKQYIDHCGLRIVGAALGELSAALKLRLFWKLPKSYKTSVEQSFVLAEDKAQCEAATKLLLKLAREVRS